MTYVGWVLLLIAAALAFVSPPAGFFVALSAGLVALFAPRPVEPRMHVHRTEVPRSLTRHYREGTQHEGANE